LPEVKKRVPFEDVSYLVVLAVGASLGLWAGVQYGGRRALRRIGRTEYNERTRRAGLQ
jgi:hypothetical protein